MKKVIKKIINIFSFVLIGIEIILITFMLINRFCGNNNSIFGLRFYIIATPSMSPEIEVGDVIISKNYRNGMKINVGDVITYIGSTGSYEGRSITHEIISIDGDTIITKGIANSDADPAINFSMIESKMLYKSFLITFIYRILSSTFAFFLLIFIPLLVWICVEILKFINQVKNKDTETIKKGVDFHNEKKN